MTLLPFVNQFLVSTFVSLYMLVSTLFPHATSVQQKSKAARKENTIVKTVLRPSPTEKPSTQDDKPISQNSPVTADTKMLVSNTETSHTVTDAVVATPTESVSNTSHSDAVAITVTPSLSQTITAKTTLSASGKTIHITMQYPSAGGTISGSMSGDCNGTLSGIYSGPTDQTLSGNGSASCPMGFISVPVDITYSGKLTSATNAQITYTIHALGKTETGVTGLSLTQ